MKLIPPLERPSLAAPQWCTGVLECFDCGHTREVVWFLGAPQLECPRCNSTNTDRTIDLIEP